MANTKDSQSKTAAELPSETNTAVATPDTINKHHFHWHGVQKILLVLLALVSLIAFVLSLYTSIKFWQIQNQKASFDEELDKLKQQQTVMDKQFSSMKQNMEDMLLESQKKFTALNTNLQSALTERLYQKQDWLLLKARHYLELAQINAHWSDDPKIAIALLQQADSILQELSLQPIFPVRQVIAKEIAQLQALPPIDIPGILSQLDALQTIVSKQPVIDENAMQTEADTTQQKSGAPVSAWQTQWQQSKSFLEKLIVVRHYEGDIEPALSPIHKALLRENIRMNLQAAQWAVLQNNTKLYQQSLRRAVQNIERAFENNTPATQSLLKQLQTLQQTALRVAKPVIDQSLQLLNQVISSNTNLRASPVTPAGGKTP
jgi:uroporphyrin-3 C-methyltransferase